MYMYNNRPRENYHRKLCVIAILKTNNDRQTRPVAGKEAKIILLYGDNVVTLNYQ